MDGDTVYFLNGHFLARLAILNKSVVRILYWWKVKKSRNINE
ncbi:hypothetical protein D104_00920 [Marinomonas profundimaris]|uniref:Uncharacterized protein n=1 Tax=Marinomonas profundimaris TaxID=1208321 RepID=W1S0L4_9GAMM|nr:hypothetical protein D104_00920 [Marinomonas profundimaris]